MSINSQPLLENDKVILYPLKENDFEALYAVASDPEIWEQHPNQNRWKKDVFRNFFDGAMLSEGAFKVVDKTTGDVIGSTRLYDYNQQEKSLFIGYTFYAKGYWGKGLNQLVKTMILDYAFQFLSKVYLHIGANNIRSQRSISRLGAEKIAEQEVTYFGEAPKQNFVYEIDKQKWETRKSNEQLDGIKVNKE